MVFSEVVNGSLIAIVRKIEISLIKILSCMRDSCQISPAILCKFEWIN